VRAGLPCSRPWIQAQTAKVWSLVSTLVLPRPNLEVVFPIGSRFYELAQANRNSRVSNQAIGLMKQGFPVMVGAADAMLSKPLMSI